MLTGLLGVAAFIALLATAIIGGYRIGGDIGPRRQMPRLLRWCLMPFVPLTIVFVAGQWLLWSGEAAVSDILAALPVFWVLLGAVWIPPSLFAAFYARHRNRRAMNVIDVLDIL